MTLVDKNKIALSETWKANADILLAELLHKLPDERSTFIESKRDDTWGDEGLVSAFRSDSVVGNKCWYSEAPLVGADANIDHFRPKGRVIDVDVDQDFKKLGELGGYWWLAFDWENYRLSCQHSNQRRVDIDTQGGKWDYFPVRGPRAVHPPGQPASLIIEDYLPLDPCSGTDVGLLRYSTEGKVKAKEGASEEVERRIKATEWLYHLDKWEIAKARRTVMSDAYTKVKNLMRDKALLDQGHAGTKATVDSTIAELKQMLERTAPFRLAVECLIKAKINGTDLGDLIFGPQD